MKQLSLLVVCAAALSAQTLQISPNPLILTTQPNTGGAGTISFTSSGGPINFLVAPNPSTLWLHVSPTTQLTTPATVSVTTDPMAASASSSLNVTIQGQPNVSVPVTVNVSPVGVNPTAMNFSYTLGGSLPPSQPITVSLPAGTTASVSKTGNWLNYAVTGGNTPTSITATLDPVVTPTLTPGTYTGSITVTPTNGSNLTPATVQVTLTVSSTPQVTITPASLTFTVQINGANNQTQQTLQLSAGAQGIPNFAIVPTVNWLSVNPSVGTIPANGSVPITVSLGLPSPSTPGTYTGALNITTATTQQVPVTVVESTNPVLNIPATPLSFTYGVGQAVPTAINVTPTSTGAPATQITYNVTANQPWLVVPPTATTPNAIAIGVNPTGLGPGNYTGTVTFTNTATGGLSQTLQVNLKVTNNPTIAASPGQMIFVYQVGQQQPLPQTLSVASPNGTPLNYTASTSTPWLILVGHTSGTTNDSFTVSVNTTGVPVGVNQGQINITATDPATGAAAGSISIPVALDVDNKALLVVNPQSVVLAAQAGSGQTPSQDILLSSTSPTDQLALTESQPTSSWLFLQSRPTSTSPGGVALRLTAVTNGLSPGVYNDSVTINAVGPGGAVLDNGFVIPVTLVITTGTITAAPATLSFSQVAGAAAPAAQTINITSTPPGLSYFVSTSDSGFGWLTATTNATATPGAVSVSVDASRLSPGTYQGRVIVTSLYAAGSPLTIPVTLQVTSGTISAPTTPLVFTVPAGSTTALTQSVAVSGSPGPLGFSVSTVVNNNGNWLSAAPATGTTPAAVQVTVNPSTLGIGTYTGTVSITSPGAAGSPINIPVTVNVVTAQTLTVTPSTLTFNYTLNQTAPAAQTVQVQSSSGTAIPFTAAASTSNNGNWLQVSPTTGNTPAALTVSVNTQNLTAGTYTGTIAVTSSNALAATPIQVTLNVTQTPKPVITAVRNAASYFLGALSPGEMVSIFGTGIGPATGLSGVVNSAGKVATTLGGTRVLFDNVEAPIIFTRTDQTTVMVPYEVAGRPNTNIRVEFNGVQSDPVAYNIADTAPGIFTLNQQGTGPGAILNGANFSVNSPNAPAPKGSYVSVYMTGEGATTPPGVTGALVPADGSANKIPLATVTATVGGVPAFVQYAGSAPGTVNGFSQVNVQIPNSAPSGVSVPIVITFTTPTGSNSTQPGVTVVVQ